MNGVYHLLGFHMHQLPANLELLIDTNEWEARQIMLCYESTRQAHDILDGFNS